MWDNVVSAFNALRSFSQPQFLDGNADDCFDPASPQDSINYQGKAVPMDHLAVQEHLGNMGIHPSYRGKIDMALLRSNLRLSENFFSIKFPSFRLWWALQDGARQPGACGPLSVSALIYAAGLNQEFITADVLPVLAGLNDLRILPTILHCFDPQTNCNVRAKVLENLIQQGHEVAELIVLKAWRRNKDSEDLIRGLGILKIREAVPELLEIFEVSKTLEFADNKAKSSSLQTQVLQTLGAIGDPRAIPFLYKIAIEKHGKFFSYLNTEATKAIGAYHDPQHRPLFRYQAQQFHYSLASEGIMQLAQYRYSEDIALLTALASLPIQQDTRDEYIAKGIRRAAVKALGQFKNPEVIPTLLKHLEDKDLAATAAASLAPFSARPEVREALQNLSKDDSNSRQNKLTVAPNGFIM